jgi:D-alanyl-D-alanine carboxypeptidase
MKRPGIIFLIAGALIALLAALVFSRSGPSAIRPDGNGAVATSSQNSLPSVSPDAQLSSATSSSSAFNLNAKAAAVGDLATGNLLYGFNADMRWPVASITKIMTAQIILDLMDPEAIVTMAPSDFSGGGSSLTVNLQPGDQYRVRELLKILLLPSSNEAAFMAAMNAKAAAWGLGNTHFDDPSGISVANQSTPREFVQLARMAYALHPEIFEITKSRVATAQELSTGSSRQFSTTNNFAGRAGFLGGKTGTTPEAGDNLISIFQTDRGPVAVLVFGAIDRYAATESLLQLIR